jgi:nitric oxide dioxygenase
MNLTPRQISLVQYTFRKLQPIARTFAELFYTRLFALQPELRDLLEETGKDWAQRAAGLMRIMGVLVSNLHKLDSLKRTLAVLANSGLGHALSPPVYDAAGQALIWTLARGLEDEFTDEAKLAWLDAYSLLAEFMAGPLYAARVDGMPAAAGMPAV